MDVTAYEALRAEQLTISSERSGTKVADISLPPGFTSPPVATPPQSRCAARLRKLGTGTLGRLREGLRYDLHADPPFGIDMVCSWSRKLAAAARVAGPRYPDSQGFPPLRAAIADYLARRRGIVCTESDILIVSGTQQATTVAARAVVDEGDTVAIEDPHYLYVMQLRSGHEFRAPRAAARSIRTTASLRNAPGSCWALRDYPAKRSSELLAECLDELEGEIKQAEGSRTPRVPAASIPKPAYRG